MDNHTLGIIAHIPTHGKPYFSVVAGFFSIFAVSCPAISLFQF